MLTIFKICENESHPGLQLVEKLAMALHLNGKLSTVQLTACPLLIFSQVHLQGRALIRDTRHHHYLGFFPRKEHEQTFSLLGFLGWTRGFLPSYSFLRKLAKSFLCAPKQAAVQEAAWPNG